MGTYKMQQFSTLSPENRLKAGRTLASPMTSSHLVRHSRIGPGPVFHSVPFPSRCMLDSAHSCTKESRRVPVLSYEMGQMERNETLLGGFSP